MISSVYVLNVTNFLPNMYINHFFEPSALRIKHGIYLFLINICWISKCNDYVVAIRGQGVMKGKRKEPNTAKIRLSFFYLPGWWQQNTAPLWQLWKLDWDISYYFRNGMLHFQGNWRTKFTKLSCLVYPRDIYQKGVGRCMKMIRGI